MYYHHYRQPLPSPPPPPFRQTHRRPPRPGVHGAPYTYLVPMHRSAGTYSYPHTYDHHAKGAGAHAGRTSDHPANYLHVPRRNQPHASRPTLSAATYGRNSGTGANTSTSVRKRRQESPLERQQRLEYLRKFRQRRKESGAAKQANAGITRRRRERAVRLELSNLQYSGDVEAVVPVMLEEVARRNDRTAENAGKPTEPIRSIVGDVLATLNGYSPSHLGSLGTTAGTSTAPEVPVPPVAAAQVAVATATTDDSNNSAVSPLTEASRKASQDTELPIADDNVDLLGEDAPNFPTGTDDDSHNDKCNQSCDGVSCPNDSNAVDNACADADGHAHEEATSVPVVKISRKDGGSEVVYRKNPACVGSLHKGGEVPRFIGESKEVSSGKTMRLPHHPSTNDPYLPKRVAKCISTRVKRPDGDIAHRVEIVDGDAGDSHLATVVWVPYEVLDENIKSTVGLDDEAWPCGTAKETFWKAYKKVRDHEMFGKSGKPSASGEYAEAGYGTGSGSQSTSVTVRTGKGKDEGVNLPYLRNPCFTTDVEASLGDSMGIITQYLKEEEPDLLQGLRENGDGTINRALTYPRPDPSGPFRSAPTILTNQVATRLVGCPKDGHINDKRKLQSQYGGSGLHVDSGDPDSKTGSLTVYICFDDDADPNASRNTRKFKYSDLAIFQKKTGGRAAVIETMQPGFVCLVFHHPSRHLHGSVFPNKNKPQPLMPGCEGMKVVCYQSKQVLKLAEHCHANEDVFDHYVQEHDEFRRGVQRKGQNNNALCHFAPLARVLQEYLADMDAKRERDEYISQIEKERAYNLSSLLWSISCDLDDLRMDENFDWSNTFVNYVT